MFLRLLSLFFILLLTQVVKAHNLEPLHVDGRYLKDSKGDIVTMHGVMACCGPYRKSDGYERDEFDAAKCLEIRKATINKVLEAGWKMDYVRLKLDEYWCTDFNYYLSDPLKSFDFELFKQYFDKIYLPLIDYYHEKGVYTVLFPPLTAPDRIEVGDEHQEHLLMIWDYVSSHPRIRNNPGVMFELSNEPMSFTCKHTDDYINYQSLYKKSATSFKEIKDYWQPIVDRIRSYCDNIIYIPGQTYQTDFSGFADFPVQGDNIGYSIHWYPGWWGNMRKDWEEHVFPIAYMAPVIITETAWGYRIDSQKATTDNFGKPLKDIIDDLGNVSWNCYEPQDEYYYLVNSSESSEKAVIANDTDACFKSMYQWWGEYAKTKILPISQMKADKVLLNDFPTVITPGEKYIAKIKAEFANGMTWDVSGDTEYTVADESILSIRHGVIWALKEGTTNVTATYNDGTGQTFSKQFEVTCTMFPLTADGFNPNLQMEGSFDESTATFSSQYYCMGGWSFAGDFDFSSYKYLVVQLNQKPEGWAKLRIMDDANVWSENEAWDHEKGENGFDLNNATELVIDLHSLHKKDGKPIDLLHIYYVGIWIDGAAGSVSIKRVFFSNDGVTPVYYQIPTRVYADNKVMFCGEEIPSLTYSVSGQGILGVPKLSTIANSTTVGTFPIFIEQGDATGEQTTFIDGTLTILDNPETANEGFETAFKAVKNMKLGWNLWNSLESMSGDVNNMWIEGDRTDLAPKDYETAWGNPVTKPELLKMMRKAGFNAVRVPVSWFPHTSGFKVVTKRGDDGETHYVWDISSWESYDIDPAWMKRVHEVVDYVIDQGMYCILNIHHDTGEHSAAWIRAERDNLEQNHERFEALWRQIAEEFKDYDEHLLFEGYNEMLDNRGQWGEPIWGVSEVVWRSNYEAVNNYAQCFVNAVRNTGGNNRYRNLVVNTYAGSDSDMSIENLQIPEDQFVGHLIFQVHCYDELNSHLEKFKKEIAFKGVPLIIGEWGRPTDDMTLSQEIDYGRYFVKQTKAFNIGTFNWVAPISGGEFRSYPAFESPEYIKALTKSYHGEAYEPTLLSKDDYEYVLNKETKVTFGRLWTEVSLCGKELSLDDYTGIFVGMGNTEDIHLLVKGERENMLQRYGDLTSSNTYTFDRSILGEKATKIELQNMRDGKNETTINSIYLIKHDGTMELLDKEDICDVWGCTVDKGGYRRKQFVHNVTFNGLWAQLDIFHDYVPLKMKNYKGIRLKLAEVPQEGAFNIHIIGDKYQQEDSYALTETSTTILFNPEIFKNEIDRVYIMSYIEGKTEVKVISAWLIRHDGTEEYSDLYAIPNWGCEIITAEPYVTAIREITANKPRATQGVSHVYNLAGQRLTKPQKGINIIDGRKVVIK